MITVSSPRRIDELRATVIDVEARRLLVARLAGTSESQDGCTEVNCCGFGRIRTYRHYKMHLRTAAHPELPPKPLLRGHPPVNALRTQVFQIACCDWRCWYCYVDDELLEGCPSAGALLSAREIVDLYLEQPDPPDVLELSGGQPEVTPEWIVWTMDELTRRGMAGRVFLWSEDSLSVPSLLTYLSSSQRDTIVSFPHYSRVGCFKGFDPDSFAFNTRMPAPLYWRQFKLFRMLLDLGIDLYAYATLTCPPRCNVAGSISKFTDDLQRIHHYLPLRTIPLKIVPFQNARRRMNRTQAAAVGFQMEVYHAWETELARRYAKGELLWAYDEVPMP